MENEKLTPEILSSVGAIKKDDFSFEIKDRKTVYTLSNYPVNRCWYMRFANNDNPSHSIPLPDQIITVDDLQKLWRSLTGKELEALN